MTRRDFEQEFASAEECLVAALDCGLALLARALLDAVQGETRWLSRVRLGLVAALRFLDSQPHWAPLMLTETPLAGAKARERRERALARLAGLLDRGSPTPGASGALALQRGLKAELVVGGAVSVLRTRALKQDDAPLLELAPSLMSLIVLPYLGAEAARAELERRPPRPRSAAPSRPSEKRAPRATYRTARVLRAIGRAPHSNNREIAAAAGLGDEGQTSKLLSRLHRQGLIENVGLGQAYGEPNAWLLTAQGMRVAEVLGRDFAQHSPFDQPGPRGGGRTACQS